MLWQFLAGFPRGRASINALAFRVGLNKLGEAFPDDFIVLDDGDSGHRVFWS
jgi:hypothetical protein